MPLPPLALYLVGENEVGLGGVLPLAGLAIRLTFVVARVALAEERALGVDALLGTSPGHIVALVGVLALVFVSHQLVA